MRYGKEEKLIDWVEKTVLALRKDTHDYKESNLAYVDNLLAEIDELMEQEKARNLPGGTTYSLYMKNALLNVKAMISYDKIPGDLASKRLEHLSKKILEAIEIFKGGK